MHLSCSYVNTITRNTEGLILYDDFILKRTAYYVISIIVSKFVFNILDIYKKC